MDVGFRKKERKCWRESLIVLWPLMAFAEVRSLGLWDATTLLDVGWRVPPWGHVFWTAECRHVEK